MTQRSISASGTERDDFITRSLFESDDYRISEENIAKVLDGKIVIPDTLKLAIYSIVNPSVYRYYNHWYSNENYLKHKQDYYDTLVGSLQNNPRIEKILNLPSVLLSPDPGIHDLREAAVRLQAEMLLILSIKSDLYYRSMAFSKDEVKAYATVEAILFDVRTGIIPHSTIITRDFFTLKKKEDLTDFETRQRAVSGAIIHSMIETGTRLNNFLEQP